jgi:quercetin dioxygenase-like cupin family protein
MPADEHTQSGRTGKEIVVPEEIAGSGRGGPPAAPELDRRSLWVLGELVTCKVTSAQTSGAYSLFEVTSPPGSGPPAHVQHRENEAFYVLEGEYEFLVEDSTTRVSAGCLLHVPKGTLHRHDNVGDIPARMLVIQTPGGLHQAFFEEIGEETSGRWESQVPERPESLARTREIAAGYGIEILPTEKAGQANESITERRREDLT